MNVEKAIEKYIKAVESDAFASYEKDFACRITSALSKCYQDGLGETDMVEIIEQVINNLKKLTTKSKQPYFELSTNAIFIHGYPKKSGVEFDYYEKSVPTELGDIIFIISIIFNGQKYFEKFTINQFKKDVQRKRAVSWNIKEEQLYLLSRFPTFRGVTGSIVPQKNFNLPNYSGCLGSYGLLYGPGDFAFISGTRLGSYLNSSKRINTNDLFYIYRNEGTTNMDKLHCSWHGWSPMVEFCRCFYKPYCDLCFYLSPFNQILGNCHFSMNVYDFASKYLRLCIGEPTETKVGISNLKAKKFLYELLSSIKAKRKGIMEVVGFIDGYLKYALSNGGGEGGFIQDDVSDFEGGGIGIVHTIINLSE